MKDPRPLRGYTEWKVQPGYSGFLLQRGEYGKPETGAVVSVYIDLGEIAAILREGRGVWHPQARAEMREALDG